MWRRPIRTCNGPIPASNIQAIRGNAFRSGLGVGMSPAIKKAPPVIYRPGVGHQKPVCCLIQYVNIPTINPVTLIRILDGGTAFASGIRIIDGNGGTVSYDGGKP